MPRLKAMAVCCASCALAAAAPTLPPLQPFVKINAPVLVLENVRVIDGTGAPAKENQRIVIENGKIYFGGIGGHERDAASRREDQST